MRPRARPLTADEIAVRGRDRTLSRRHHLAVRGKAHRAARLAPFEARVGEYLVEPFGNRLALDGLRARHHPGAAPGRNLAATRDFGRRTQIAHPAVGAGT